MTFSFQGLVLDSFEKFADQRTNDHRVSIRHHFRSVYTFFFSSGASESSRDVRPGDNESSFTAACRSKLHSNGCLRRQSTSAHESGTARGLVHMLPDDANQDCLALVRQEHFETIPYSNSC